MSEETPKACLRSQVRSAIASLTPAALQRASEACCQHVQSVLQGREGLLMGYLPLPGELDPLAAMGWWLDCRQPLAVPCVDWASSTMCAGRLASLDDSLLVNGPHGTREPALVEPVAASAIDVVLVPGLAFDSRGNRMGRGGGFYDRFLATLGPQVQLLGLCVGEQLVDEIPTEPHDRPVDLVIHPAGVIDAR